MNYDGPLNLPITPGTIRSIRIAGDGPCSVYVAEDDGRQERLVGHAETAVQQKQVTDRVKQMIDNGYFRRSKKDTADVVLKRRWLGTSADPNEGITFG